MIRFTSSKQKSKIAQLIIDMSVGERKPIKRPELVQVLEEVNNSKMIGHALRIVKDSEGNPTHVKKYRKAHVERLAEKQQLEQWERDNVLDVK